jgi:hypothetical protein
MQAACAAGPFSFWKVSYNPLWTCLRPVGHQDGTSGSSEASGFPRSGRGEASSDVLQLRPRRAG